MDKLKFIQAITRLRVLETRLLDKMRLERMIEGANAEAVLKMLDESNYGDQLTPLSHPEAYEQVLGTELIKLYRLMYEVSPEKALIDIFSIRYDYHNLKVLIKAKALNKTLDHLIIPVYNIEYAVLKESVFAEDYKALPETFRCAVAAAEDAYRKTGDPQKIDIMIDRFIYKDMLERANNLDEPFVIELIQTMIDFVNIRSYLRLRRQNKDRAFLNEVLLPGGTVPVELYENLAGESLDSLVQKLAHTKYQKLIKEGFEEYARVEKFNSLEKQMDNYLMNYLKQGKIIAFGVEPLVSYLLAKETEIRNVRIIMVGKINHMVPAAIRERLRDVYV